MISSEAVQKEIVLKQENWSLHCRKVFKNMIGTCYYSCLQNSFEALMECSVRLLHQYDEEAKRSKSSCKRRENVPKKGMEVE